LFDDPTVQGNLISGTKIADFVEIAMDERLRFNTRRRAKLSLKKACYRAVRLYWSDMLFCDNKLGINGAIPPNILHMMRHGLMQYCLGSFFGLKRLLAKARKVKKKGE
jgi:hypothetical protein